MTLTPKQIANVAATAGFTGQNLQIAVAVALAESSGNPTVVNSLGCVGLWQIYQGVWVQQHPSWTTEWLKVPQNNAKAAHTVFLVQGWGGWSTFTSGAYKNFMQRAASGVANRTAGDPGIDDGTQNQEIGGASGAENNIGKVYLKNTPSIDDFYLMGNKIKEDIKDRIISATAEFTTDQVSQITIQILDPHFEFLNSGLCRPGTPAQLQNIKLVVATTETGSTSGTPTVTLKCRPEVVQKLKSRTGTKVMSNASPSDFVKAECKAVGANALIQASPKRVSVARDLPKPGTVYDLDQTPSSWTTFQRLATELGYVCFEENGTIYFGQPTYIVGTGKALPVNVGYQTGPDAQRAFSIPECTTSLDTLETDISVNLPLSRAFEARCGRTLNIDGISKEFNGYYLISSISYNLSGQTELLNLSAKTPIDPIAQPPEGSNVAFGSLNDAGVTSDGSWPLPKNYKVTTAYGVRGSWAAGFHTGADFACPQGTPVYAVYDGTIVSKNSWGADYGTHVILKVGKAEYGYCHLSRITAAVGSTVKSGQVIGYSGNTGNTTGPHLHLEYRTSPFKYNNKIADPMPTLMKNGVASGVSSIGSGKGNKLASDFVYYAQTRAGGTYVYGAARNPSNPNQMEFDCSSLVQWALYQVGITNFPGDTVSQTAYLNKKGTEIEMAQAYKIRGALLYKREGGGKNDHVAISLGDGTTIEASSPSVGIGNQSAYNRGFNHAYLVPGLKYS